ncbi:MAG TPA: DoxX family protein [Bryobacteraceae bacterium]|nr:DoxX family protein [Bryobacteraceae bacterium]
MSKKMILSGRILSGVMVAFLLLDGIMHITNIAPVVDASTRLGLPVSLAPALGVLELACVALYVLPRTSVLGAILLTGYLGGAVAIHLRAGSPLFGEALFPVYVGILLWGGLYLREPRLRALILRAQPVPAAEAPQPGFHAAAVQL